ncbi:hypothetical protein MMN46_23905 [Escherichia coli]|uniref:hypothetical protein n=1 Tax=Escherichia coli TaxID=562 RepID=UPI001F14358A|nr:hypothetical protein [Escherichia coli]MCH6444640.1 hypothetical protein [Escherichia coli]
MERSHEYHPNQRYSATLPDTGTTPGNPISSVRFRAGVPESPIWKIFANVTLFSTVQDAFHRHDLRVLKTVEIGHQILW